LAVQLVRVLFLGGAVAAVLAAGGCTSFAELDGARDMLADLGSALGDKMSANYDPPDYDGPPLAELPTYQLGDSYTYSSGRTETVAEIHDERIVWQNDLQSEFERYRNFVLPTAVTRTDSGEITRTFDAPPDVLWPLIPGTRRQYNSVVSVRLHGQNRERRFRRDWICTVNGSEQVVVQFGAFDSVKISCERYGRGMWRQTRTWYYVSEIGHYVRRVDRFHGRESRDVELLSIQQGFEGMNRNAKRALYDLEQQTLERMPSGKPARWRSTDGAIAVTMTVTKTVQTEAGQFCRTFHQEVEGNGIERLVPGLACRTWNGRWVRL
jgi:surface antigen